MNTPLPDDPQEWPDEGPRRNEMLELVKDAIVAALAVGYVMYGFTIYIHYPTWPGILHLALVGVLVAVLAIMARRR